MDRTHAAPSGTGARTGRYAASPSANLVAHARVSTRTFYEQFADKEEASRRRRERVRWP